MRALKEANLLSLTMYLRPKRLLRTNRPNRCYSMTVIISSVGLARLKISCLSCLASLVSHQPTFCVRPATEHAQYGKLQTWLLTYTVHKSKTLLVQGKAVHVQSTRNSLRQIWEETIQLYIDASTAMTSNWSSSRHPWTRSRWTAIRRVEFNGGWKVRQGC